MKTEIAKHTAGPWVYEESTKTIRSVPSNYWLATMDSWDGAVCHEANARLIAAAPELLKACEETQKELLGASSYLETCDPVTIVENLDTLVRSLKARLVIVEAALRKAKGEL